MLVLRRARHHGGGRRASGAAARPAVLRPGHRAADGDRALLRHADGDRAHLEEPADASGVGLLRLDREVARPRRRSTGSPNAPLTAIVIIVAWQWLPFATLILLTAIQSLDEEQKEAAEIDNTPPLSFFYYIVLPHLARPITVVILIETIFLLNVFAEILVTTGGGPGQQTTNLPSSSMPRRFCSTMSAAHRPAASSR